ncbi:MAG: hypothetical protein PWP31_936 [Clostridia bacterium]|nr:hypothetical protein [Clostridia bacterium]
MVQVTAQFHEIIKVKSKIQHNRRGLKLQVFIVLNQIVDEDFLREFGLAAEVKKQDVNL